MKKILSILFILVMCCSFVFAQGSQGVGRSVNVISGNSNSNLKGHLEQFQERHQERLMNCEENCSINVQEGELGTQIRVRRQARFMFWNVNAEETFEVDEEGEILKQNRNLWQWAYENKIIKQGAE